MIINGKVATDEEAAYAVEVKPSLPHSVVSVVSVTPLTTNNQASGVDAAVDAVLNEALKMLVPGSFGNGASA